MAVGVQYYINGTTNMSGQSDAQIMWMITDQDIENNTSTIYFRFRVRKQNSSSATTGYGNWTLKMGDQTATAAKSVTIKNSWVYLISTTRTFTHNADGTLSLYVTGTGGIGGGTGYSKTTCYATITIDTIPRATEPTITDITTHPDDKHYFSDQLSLTLTPAANTFLQDISYAYIDDEEISDISTIVWESEWSSLKLNEGETSITKTFTTSREGLEFEDINYKYLHFKTDTYQLYEITDYETGIRTEERVDIGTKLNHIQLYVSDIQPTISAINITKTNLQSIDSQWISNVSQFSIFAIASFIENENFYSATATFNGQSYPMTSVSSANSQNTLKVLSNPEDPSSSEIIFTTSLQNTNNTVSITVYDNYGFSTTSSYTLSPIVEYQLPEFDANNAFTVSKIDPSSTEISGKYLSYSYGIKSNNYNNDVATIPQNQITATVQILPTNVVSDTTSWINIENGSYTYRDNTTSIITHNGNSTGYYTTGDIVVPFDDAITYTVRLSLQDYVMSELGMSPKVVYKEIKQAGAVMSWKHGGTNITFGGQANDLSSDYSVESHWQLRALEGFYVEDGLSSEKSLILGKTGLDTYSYLIDILYPIGALYFSTSSVNPSYYLGGYWEPFAQGRTLIGVGEATDDSSYTMSFSPEEEGGEYLHTLTSAEMPAHAHTLAIFSSGSGNADKYTMNSNRANLTRSTSTEGGDQPHNNLPPYIAVYIWRRCNPPAQQGE